jgi:four helix bundle protein
MSQNNTKIFDLEERTAKFGEEVIKFTKKVPLTSITKSIISQLIRATTSVGANYCEADDAFFKKDFLYKISLCRKETRESKHWLRMIAQAVPEFKEEAKLLWREAQELNLIFSAIINKSKKKKSKKEDK